MHLLSIEDYSRNDLNSILEESRRLKSMAAGQQPALATKLLATLFFQASTRTRFSFEAAMHRLGGSVLSFSPEGTRAGQGWNESLGDTARVMNGYADAIVMRHPEVGSLREYASYSTIPVINGGNGIGPGSEHPTQAILDLYTIYDAFGTISGLRMLMIGNMQLRGARSLLKALAKYDDVTVFVVCPDDGWLDNSVSDCCAGAGLPVTRVGAIEEVVDQVEVVYHHGLSEDPNTPVPEAVLLTPAKLRRLPQDAILLHALPRSRELPFAIDAVPQARYFPQAANGVYTRMAILQRTLAGADGPPTPDF